MRIITTSDIILDGTDTRAEHLLGLFNSFSQLSEVYLFVAKKNQEQNDPHIKCIPRLRTIYPIRIISYEISMFIYLFFFCMNIKIDAIYHRQSGLNLSPLLISKIFKIPFFVEVNGLLVNESKMTSDTYRVTKFQLMIAKISERFNYKYSTKIIAVAEGIKQGIIKTYNIPPEKVTVIQNGADTCLFKPLNKKDLNLSFSLNDTYKYVGFIGSFAPWHGLEYLVNSAPLVLSEYPNVKYVLVGDGGMKTKIKKMVNDLGLNTNFIFIDQVPHNEVSKYINIFDICTVLKDKNIPGSPLKLAEYMACGKPVIATNSEDFEVLNEIDAGILVDPDNLDELSLAIVTLLKDDSLRHKMGINAREYVVKNRSWLSVAESIYHVICECIKGECG